ncbi:uncharacterized protein LOC124263235 [Haliotis rubra]|uniref:uncharacterized protein LOC124263235 n=1 Tax=Haliotis rubra TaxID=36100 RepID=UPI001EE55AA6|nr:uncharacterized protein LOC124263235 [Haliotis rubra]
MAFEALIVSLFLITNHSRQRSPRLPSNKHPYTSAQAVVELFSLSVQGPIAALPVIFRTTPQQKCFQCLTDPVTGAKAYPAELAPLQCTRAEIRQFATEARELGVQYIGLCCGSASYYLREVAIAYGRNPPSAKFEPDLSMSIVTGSVQLFERGDRARKVRAFMLGDIQ